MTTIQKVVLRLRNLPLGARLVTNRKNMMMQNGKERKNDYLKENGGNKADRNFLSPRKGIDEDERK